MKYMMSLTCSLPLACAMNPRHPPRWRTILCQAIQREPCPEYTLDTCHIRFSDDILSIRRCCRKTVRSSDTPKLAVCNLNLPCTVSSNESTRMSQNQFKINQSKAQKRNEEACNNNKSAAAALRSHKLRKLKRKHGVFRHTDEFQTHATSIRLSFCPLQMIKSHL